MQRFGGVATPPRALWRTGRETVAGASLWVLLPCPATGETVASLDAVEERAILADGKQAEFTVETHGEWSWEAGDGLDRGQEAERIEARSGPAKKPG